jgi:hypothetical protein
VISKYSHARPCTVDLAQVSPDGKLVAATDIAADAKDGGLADIGPAGSNLVVLDPVNSDFESASRYVWDVP